MSNRPPHEILRQQDLMIRALEINYGNVKLSAKEAGIAPSTHYRWRKEYEDYERKTDTIKDVGYRDLKETLIDIALKKAEKATPWY
jgi:transposase-like protein